MFSAHPKSSRGRTWARSLALLGGLAALTCLGITIAIQVLSSTPPPKQIATGQDIATPTLPLPTLILPTVEATPTLPLPEPTTASSGTETILFDSAGELYRLPVDTESKTLGTVDRFSISIPENFKVEALFPSPDGRQILYGLYGGEPDVCCEGTARYYVLTVATGETKEVKFPTTLANFYGWHSNNRQLVFGEDSIELLDVNTGELTALPTQPQRWAQLPYAPSIHGVAFSPDGKRLTASFTLTGEGFEVWRANADGSDPTKLFESKRGVAGFVWSPDGTQIAFVSNGLEVMNPDGSNRRTVGSNWFGGAFPKWSPDSRYIAFTAQIDSTKYKVRVVDITNDTERNLISDESRSEFLPAWSPDGLKIIFLSDWDPDCGASGVWMANVDGTELEKLSRDNELKILGPAWLPKVEEK